MPRVGRQNSYWPYIGHADDFANPKEVGPKGPTEAIRAANIALADYLFVEAEPVVAGGGGIMFHVSARYFQFEPSCTMTLR